MGFNKQIANKIRKIKNYGRAKKGVYKHESIGFNFKFNDMCASIGLAQISKLKSFINKKKTINNYYRKAFKNVSQISFSESIKNSNPVYWFVVIYINNKEKLRHYLKMKGIETRDIFLPMNMQKCFKNSNSIINVKGKFKNSFELYKTGLCLPSSVNLNSKKLHYITSVIKKFYENRS